MVEMIRTAAFKTICAFLIAAPILTMLYLYGTGQARRVGMDFVFLLAAIEVIGLAMFGLRVTFSATSGRS